VSDLNEIFQDAKSFSESFYFCKHYFAEYIKVKTFTYEDQEALKLTRLRKKRDKIYLDEQMKKKYIPVEKLKVRYPETSWLCVVPTARKQDGRTVEEINFLCSFDKSLKMENVKKIKKLLKTKGITIKNKE
jgi:hypothetical protein